MAWVVYEMAPIDFWWGFLPTIAEVAAGMASDAARSAAEDDSSGLGGSTLFCIDNQQF
jgi:hypothetical protein